MTLSDPFSSKRFPFEGSIELENGLVIPWWKMAASEEEAIHIVSAQHRHVVRCWVKS